MSKLVLGTVQFGCNYGINNAAGQVPQQEVNLILTHAGENSINLLDTSAAYGNSEIALGNSRLAKKFKIVSKYPRCEKTPRECLETSLQNLQIDHLYGYLIHHFDYFLEKPEIWKEMETLKSEGKIEKIGFSIYSPQQLEYLLQNEISFDLLQFPYNIFDRQFEPYFPELKKRGVEIHTRSVFLQGLFFKDVNSFPEKLKSLRPYVEKLQNYCSSNNINIAELAVGYSVNKEAIGGVLMGVDNCAQLDNNILCSQYKPTEQDISFIDSINIKEKELLNPVNWN